MSVGDQEAKRALALRLEEEGRYDEAIELYDSLFGVGLQDEDLFLKLMGCYFEKEDPKALEWCERGLEFHPQSAELHYNAGFLCEHFAFCIEDGYTRAFNHYLKAVELNPNFGQVYANLSSFYKNPHHRITIEKAVEFLEKAVAINPTNYYEQANLADLYFEELKDYVSAKKHYELALACEHLVDERSRRHDKIIKRLREINGVNGKM